MNNFEEYKNKIIDKKSDLIRNYGISDIFIFGSLTRSDFNPSSDLDILVDFCEQPSLLKFINMKNFLTDLLGINVDLVMKSALKPSSKNEILSSAILL